MDDAAVLREVARAAGDASVFGTIEIAGPRLHCAAKGSAEPAFYRVELAPAEASVSLVTAARYLSQSIEADLVHTGDKLDDLLTDELVDQAYDGPPLRVEHYRDDDKLFTFRSRLPLNHSQIRSRPGVNALTKVLLAYEACFRPLGGMEAGDK